ncbi:hypothetical protein CcaverHIS002_0510660 [Cutaneotrichosporon cavernicola]|nr:hypothetical protein CcaverHIS002_0510660 [Cutaneotrichosporon cavernicola]
MDTQVLSTEHVLPARRSAACVPVPLISAPSVAAPYAQALLFYDKQGAAALDPNALSRSLAQTLSAYPQLAGRLVLPPTTPSTSFPDRPPPTTPSTSFPDRPPPTTPSTSFPDPLPPTTPSTSFPAYTRRFLRPWMEYGSDDPGFLLTFERRIGPLSAILPSPTQWDRVYDSSAIDFDLAPATAPNLSPSNPRTEKPLSGAKITLFDDGAALVVGISHVLADAGALGTFVEDWATIHALLPSQVEVAVDELVKKRRFDWETLDAYAAGDLDAAHPDPALEKLEEGLDVLRYDAWARGATHPPEAMDAKPDPAILELDAARGHKRGQPAPWGLLGTEPCKRYVLTFSASEVERITASARLHAPKASANDAFVAHLWRLITRARLQITGELEFTMACDARRRLNADDTPGCFNICLGLNSPAKEVLQDGWAERRIRAAVDGVTEERVGAWLHRRAHDLDFRREMICFPGTQSVCTTNWARSGVCTLDFGGGGPVYAHNLVQAFGGFATILKGRGDGVEMGGKNGGGEKGDKWYEPGVNVMLWLEESAMERLVRDPALRGYRG